MIETGHDIEIMNPDLVICTLDEGANVNMELTVETGKGYVPATQNRPEDAPIGLIPVDALFSPVRKVSYKVENTRVGQVTDYDKLTHAGRDQRRGDARGRGRARRAHPAGPAAALHQLRGAARSASRRAAPPSCRSTRTCCARSTSSSCRCVRPTA